jgi:hypothetical protein
VTLLPLSTIMSFIFERILAAAATFIFLSSLPFTAASAAALAVVN